MTDLVPPPSSPPFPPLSDWNCADIALNNNQSIDPSINQPIPGLSLIIIPSSKCCWIYFINSYYLNHSSSELHASLKNVGTNPQSRKIVFTWRCRKIKSMKKISLPQKSYLGPPLLVEAREGGGWGVKLLGCNTYCVMYVNPLTTRILTIFAKYQHWSKNHLFDSFGVKIVYTI